MQQGYYMALVQGRVYIGQITKEPVIYLGCWNYDGTGAPRLHQFEYVKPDPKVAGYGQTTDQANNEHYIESKPLSVLYGRIID